MLPRETNRGRDGKTLPTPQKPRREPPHDRETFTEHAPRGVVSDFAAAHYRHFNSARLIEAAHAYAELIDRGGLMFLSMAGAGSTGELGRVLAPMIRAGKISAMSVTGANLEEDLFLLVGYDQYRPLPDYHEHSPAEDQALGEEGHPRVTDVTIPEDAAMKPVTEAVRAVWREAMGKGDRLFPHEALYRVIQSGTLADQYRGDVENSWLVAAADRDLPLFTPGWEDSTLGNVFAADCVDAKFDPSMIKMGVEAMMELAGWYRNTSADHPLGFFQLGGGIPGDFAICVVPMLIADLKEENTPKWEYFCQMTDADESVGGYSGALPTEKASWMKIGADTPAFSIKGDYTIGFPMLAAVVMGW